MSIIEIKKEFSERMKKLLPEEDFQKFLESLDKWPINSIRCNTIKISPTELKNKLEQKGWLVRQPFPQKEIIIIESSLKPGELGNSEEHRSGLYYIQDISSMMPVLALNPQADELVLDICASPGSKTTYISSLMSNQGTIIANEKNRERVKILKINLQKCFCSNVIVTKHDAVQLCLRLSGRMKFDKILLDLECSGEGTLNSDEEKIKSWNMKKIEKFSRQQKKIAFSVMPLLKPGGELVYSTCTLAPEENEEIVSFLVKKFNLKIKKISLPLKTRQGIESWGWKKICRRNKKLFKDIPPRQQYRRIFPSQT